MNQEQKDKATIKELMEQSHDAAYLDNMHFAQLALLDLIDNQVEEQHKQRLAQAVERMKETDLEPLQAKIDQATYELHREDSYTATPGQQLFVQSRRNNLSMNRMVSTNAHNKLLTNFLINSKGMKVSKELRDSLHSQGFDELVKAIDEKKEQERIRQNWHASKPAKTHTKSKSLKLSM
ncbi:MAG: hypothetical protein GY734_21760 [Herbaspirillum sp.]|uniref:hypothetical protein n=1 Tax=Herbaspirillum sp. TaxID=1890675 RepID=UPI0025882860|nr:hypothetical protein [Herbaspirillum sp.]MCP3658493.1 hypothetical protein [Herbaspirillum sp.]MCP4033846.1 hypothetical protein [Herbaspirillum sp.]